jgi:ATP-dependent RNA helicase RhlB
MRFTDFDFHPDILKGIEDAGFDECMPVQEECFKAIFAGKDVTAQSQTGTGKTAAFLISIYHLFLSNKIERKKALIIAPTRELAVQIEEESKLLSAHMDFTTGCFYGGVGYNEQEDLLKKGVDIVVGTPGRLIDFGKQKKIDFSEFGVVVIDEADRLFDMGFLPDLRQIVKMLTDFDSRRTMLFSATISVRVQNLAWEYMRNPVHIEIEPEQITVEEIDQSIYHVSRDEKMRVLLGILKTAQPENAVIFTNTKFSAVEVSKRLSLNGFPCQYIMGDMPQKKRLQTINMIKEGKLRFLVATDVAARGLHINDLAMVINYDVPEDPESYVHRIGRTARAGKEGRAVTLACERFVYGLPAIESFVGIKIPVAEVDESLMAEDQSAGISVMHDYYSKQDRNPRSGGSRDRGGRRSDKRTDDRRGDKRSGGRRPSSSSGRRDAPDRSREISRDIEAVTGRQPKPGRGRDSARPAKPDPSSGNPPRSPKPAESKKPAEKSKGGSGRRPNDPAARKRREQGSQQPRKPRPAGAPSARKRPPEISRKGDQSLESRMEYYRQKYGEDFKVTPELAQAEKQRKKESLFKKVTRFMKGKKSES